MKKRLKLKDSAKDLIGIVCFYLLIVIGFMLINARLGMINEQQKSATESAVHIAQNVNR